MNFSKNNPITRLKSTEIGAHMENLACVYLKKQGLTLILRNYHCKMGEIDLIMQDDYHLVFVEVRYRNQFHYSSSLESIHYAKQIKLIKTAEYYLLKHNLSFSCHARFDVIAIDKSIHSKNESALKIHWLKNAFELK